MGNNITFAYKFTKEERKYQYLKKLLYYELVYDYYAQEHANIKINTVYIIKDNNSYTKSIESSDSYYNADNITNLYNEYSLYGDHPLLKFKNTSLHESKWTMGDKVKYKLFKEKKMDNGNVEYVPLYYGKSKKLLDPLLPSAPPSYD